MYDITVFNILFINYSNNCTSSETLKQIISEKDKIIQSIGKIRKHVYLLSDDYKKIIQYEFTANILLEINETKNLDVITDAFKIISGDMSPLSPRKSLPEGLSPVFEPASIDDKISNDFDKELTESEMDSIPSGRKSPIIQNKKFRTTSAIAINNVVQEKKKCPEIW